MDAMRRDMQRQVDVIIKNATVSSRYKTVLNVHDILCANVEYLDDCVWDRHTAVGALLDRKAVCDGYAKAFKWIMDCMEVECRIITGKGMSNGAENSHAWNLVKIDGNWRHVDVTYDANSNWRKDRVYDYFSLTGEQISRDHTFDEDRYPKTSGIENDYYTANGLLMKDKQALRDYAATQIRQGRRNFIVRLPESIPDDVAEKKISEVLSNLPLQGVGTYRINVRCNMTQHIFRIGVSGI